jgi:predicted transcriptional regulator
MERKGKVLSVRLPDDIYDKFKKICEEQDLPASLLARHIIRDWIKQQEHKEVDSNDR